MNEKFEIIIKNFIKIVNRGIIMTIILAIDLLLAGGILYFTLSGDLYIIFLIFGGLFIIVNFLNIFNKIKFQWVLENYQNEPKKAINFLVKFRKSLNYGRGVGGAFSRYLNKGKMRECEEAIELLES